MSLQRLKNRLIARLATRFPALAERLVAGYQAQASAQAIPWTPMDKPLSQCRLALVTTAGVHHGAQPLFDMQDAQGDPSFRELDGRSIEADFRITHDYYDHRDAERDLNIVLPLARLREFVAEGKLGALAERHYGFMGHIDGPHIVTLTEQTAPAVAARLKAAGVDVVLLTPA
ncbi:MAG: glycine/sarcosine/betaine reductase selenoprotein B family protein [Trichloromonadaceae bacterium]